MKLSATFYFFLIFSIFNNVIFSQKYDYISPKDNSQLVSLSTNIILRSSEDIDESRLSPKDFTVIGTLSGFHSGIVKLSDDNKTILFFPETPFLPNENISINVNQGIKTIDGETLPSVAIHFKTTPLLHPIDLSNLLQSEYELGNTVENSETTNKFLNKNLVGDSLPSDFPKITVTASNNPSNEKIFLSNITQTPSIGNYLMILNNDGSVVKYKKVIGLFGLGFKVLPNGQLSYGDDIFASPGFAYGRFIVMDTTLTPVDVFQTGNGYNYTFPASFLLLPNGHSLLFAIDPQQIDMSQYGGSPDATVTGEVIQELDASKNVVFQWRTWDYLPITDSYADLTTNTVDLIHANALAVDADGDILFSMRHLSSIIKINRQTGNIDWILGGKQNQFSYINENEPNAPNYFSFQHDIRVLPNGNITLFDNGTQHTPPYSRGVEYKLDEQNKTATLVWEYRHSPDIFASANGSVQRLENGNTILGWGQASATGNPMFTEVHPDNTVALEFTMPAGQKSFRALKFPWASGIPSATVTEEILPGNSYSFDNNTDTTGVKITFTTLNGDLYTFATVTRYNYASVNPTFKTIAPLMVSNYFKIEGSYISSFTGDVIVNLKYFPAVLNPQETIIYGRSGSDSSFVPLATSYNSTNNELTFTTSIFGDFAFGIPQVVDSSFAPVQISPKDNEIVNGEAPIKLVWGTRGIVQKYHLQVSTSPSFSSPFADVSNLTSTFFTINSVDNNSTYYWRVNNINAAGTSSWSNVESFSTSSPYIKVLSPNGSEKIYLDSTYVIRWQSNITDTVNIDLMNKNNIVSVIGDTIFSGTNAILWHVPSNLQPDSTYKVMISSISNNNLFAVSDTTFIISTGITNINAPDNIMKSYKLSQNYPNPFNPSTTIQYSIPRLSKVKITLFNLLGEKITTLVDEEKLAGSYQIKFNSDNIPSGVYFYQLKADDFVQTRKMILMK
jgi:hypothetical protein